MTMRNNAKHSNNFIILIETHIEEAKIEEIVIVVNVSDN